MAAGAASTALGLSQWSPAGLVLRSGGGRRTALAMGGPAGVVNGPAVSITGRWPIRSPLA